MKHFLTRQPGNVHLTAFVLMVVTPPLMYLAATNDATGVLIVLLAIFIGANLLELSIP